MRVNNFELTVNKGTETSDGYVDMNHGSQYKVVLTNHRSQRCDAKVTIDGEKIGEFRLEAFDTLKLERSPNDKGKFTFYTADSDEGIAAELDLVDTQDLGLIQVVFTPEKLHPPLRKDYGTFDYWKNGVKYGGYGRPGGSINRSSVGRGSSCCNFSYDAGGTGLSGHSNQDFVGVGHITRDYSEQTTISIRLRVNRFQSQARPLRKRRANKVPSPI